MGNIFRGFVYRQHIFQEATLRDAAICGVKARACAILIYFTLQSAVYHACRDDCLAGLHSAARSGKRTSKLPLQPLTWERGVEDTSRAVSHRRPQSGVRRSVPVLCSAHTRRPFVHEAEFPRCEKVLVGIIVHSSKFSSEGGPFSLRNF